MFEFTFFQWLEDTSFAESMRVSTWMFPVVETVHVLALVLVVGSIARMDLRLLGILWRNRSVTAVSAQILPWTWIAFVVAAITGTMLFSSAATRYVENVPFLTKMLLLVIAGVNMLVFHLLTHRDIARWDNDPTPPQVVRLAGAFSLLLWISIVIFGRWIGFTI